MHPDAGTALRVEAVVPLCSLGDRVLFGNTRRAHFFLAQMRELAGHPREPIHAFCASVYRAQLGMVTARLTIWHANPFAPQSSDDAESG